MKGILGAYLRATEPSTPKVEATALQPPSIASFTRFSGSNYCWLGANEAPAECSIPGSTGRTYMYPARDSLPLSNNDCNERNTAGERSEIDQTRSTKSGPGNCTWSLEIVCVEWFSSSEAFGPRSSAMRSIESERCSFVTIAFPPGRTGCVVDLL